MKKLLFVKEQLKFHVLYLIHIQLMMLLIIIEELLIYLVIFQTQNEKNNFCRCLEESTHCEFNIDARIFVSKRKKLVHLSLSKTLSSYHFFHELIRFVRMYWNKRQYFYLGCFLIQARLNQMVKFKFDYILTVKRKCLKTLLTLKVYWVHSMTNQKRP